MAEHSMCHPGRPWRAKDPMTGLPNLQVSAHPNVHDPQHLWACLEQALSSSRGHSRGTPSCKAPHRLSGAKAVLTLCHLQTPQHSASTRCQ